MFFSILPLLLPSITHASYFTFRTLGIWLWQTLTAHHVHFMVSYVILLSYIPYKEVHDPKIHKSVFLQPTEWTCNWYEYNWHLLNISQTPNNLLLKNLMVLSTRSQLIGSWKTENKTMHRRGPPVFRSEHHLFLWVCLTKVIVCLEDGTHTYINTHTTSENPENTYAV